MPVMAQWSIHITLKMIVVCQELVKFKHKPVTFEMQSDATPLHKAPRKVPLALKDKFSAEIQSMVQQGILTEITQTMETLEWLNSFVIVKKPNGNLRFV